MSDVVNLHPEGAPGPSIHSVAGFVREQLEEVVKATAQGDAAAALAALDRLESSEVLDHDFYREVLEVVSGLPREGGHAVLSAMSAASVVERTPGHDGAAESAFWLALPVLARELGALRGALQG